MTDKISLTFYSDVLCIWAHIAQARIEEVKKKYGDRVEIDYRFCSVFGDTAHKISSTWADKGNYEGFANHLHDVAKSFDHITVHDELWRTCRPHSSMPAHLALKGVQLCQPEKIEGALIAMRRAFFEQALDISNADVIESVLQKAGVSVNKLRELNNSGIAHASLEVDTREKEALKIQGSPTFILNDGRQKLYGNVGYGVIEANIQELLKSPIAGTASWC